MKFEKIGKKLKILNFGSSLSIFEQSFEGTKKISCELVPILNLYEKPL